MKAKALLLFISFACAPTFDSFGQVDCTTSTKLICQLPVTSSVLNPIGGASASNAAQRASSSINASIGAQLTQLPIPSATVGVVSLRQKGSDVGVPFENLGPVLTDRPDTVGKGHLFVGFSYQHFNFNAVDGISLGSFPVYFNFSQPSPFNPNDTQTFYGGENNKVGFQLDQYLAMAVFGLTRKSDLSVVVPINSTSLRVTSSNFQAYLFDSSSGLYSNESLPAGTTISTKGTANGVGDVIVNFKQMLLGGEGSRPAISAGASFRFRNGDALNYLGSGAYGGNLYGLFEYRARVAPHLKLSYQWNGVSQIVNLQESPNTRLPGGLQYDAGADLKVIRSLTVAGDILGSQFVNMPSLALTTVTLKPVPASTSNVPASYTTVSPLNNSYTTVNISGGLKWSPIPHFLVYGNVMKQANNTGLRSDLVPLFGIAYNFKAAK